MFVDFLVEILSKIEPVVTFSSRQRVTRLKTLVFN
jgi:hypothetical protein